MENPIKMHDLGVPLFSETSVYQQPVAPISWAARKSRCPRAGCCKALKIKPRCKRIVLNLRIRQAKLVGGFNLFEKC